MNHYLTNKATQPAWWEWPAMIISGVMSAIGVYVAFDQAWTDDFFVTLLAFLLLMGFLSWPLILTLRKRLRRSQAKKLARCLSGVSGSSITFGEITRRTGIRMPEDKLQWMIGKGWFQNIAVDNEHVCVRLLGDGEPEVEAAPAEPARTVPVTGNSVYDDRLRQIRELNDRIADKSVSDKIDRIEALTADIFQLIAEHPERADEIRRFMNYYLPTTFKLLESYSLMEKQRYQGENIRASRAQIEKVLDQIIKAIERQQDKLFQSQALDVETDITVLNTMMSADGLTQESGLHM